MQWVVLAAFGVLLFIFGYCAGTVSVQQEALAAGVAEWRVDRLKGGRAQFYFIPATQPTKEAR